MRRETKAHETKPTATRRLDLQVDADVYDAIKAASAAYGQPTKAILRHAMMLHSPEFFCE